MFKKIFKIIAIIVGIVLMLFFSLFFYKNWQVNRGDLVKWEGVWYTKQELKEKFPPQYIEVPAKNTPEQVYTIFRQALLDNDIEKALEQIRKENREEYRKAFQDKEKFDEIQKRFNKWVKRFPEFIIKESEYGNFASYYYLNAVDDSDKMAHPVTFEKNSEGYWQINNI
ncbi:hypothetical protein KJ627_00585 [Patescibacteria group bacterium]|nr:hypothetical protein [Patescibacteria group bacterium]